MPYTDPEKIRMHNARRGMIQKEWAKNHPKEHAARVAGWRKNNSEKAREIARRNQRSAAGCTNATGERRGGPCMICGNIYESLHYDYSHITGLHRGWLCCWCNLKLGWFEKWREVIMGYVDSTLPMEGDK